MPIFYVDMSQIRYLIFTCIDFQRPEDQEVFRQPYAHVCYVLSHPSQRVVGA